MTTEALTALDWPLLAGALLAGAGLGLMFFAGLWLTVRRLAVARHPGIWLLASAALRFALALGGLLWLVSRGGASAGLVGVLGFALARWALARRLGPRVAAGETRP
ncbi:ATP synthase subunit I [Halomonas organivorans]|uniref:F1F0 ATPase subunit 2 n=1 Tax=Halomonas organivorans TaxID=257772 RepID=A0A7W5G3S4_9GAMM|nr:ATP synthase subunit I [Halomonas organivorans]MBB3139232.1 F1F0 ATPase subunit 2 [Halomonas organivorans]